MLPHVFLPTCTPADE